MDSIEKAVSCDDQPISGATLLRESRYLTSWITPGNLEVQRKYEQLTGSLSLKDKIRSLWNYVSGLKYKQFVSASVRVDGKTFVQKDVWLDPAQVIQAGVANCMNRSTLLASLLRQELPAENVHVVLGNVSGDGHAWVLLRLDQDYLMETTSPHLSQCFIPICSADIYDPVIFFNDEGVRYFPEKKVHEPFSNLYCVGWLEDYLDSRACDAYI